MHCTQEVVIYEYINIQIYTQLCMSRRYTNICMVVLAEKKRFPEYNCYFENYF